MSESPTEKYDGLEFRAQGEYVAGIDHRGGCVLVHTITEAEALCSELMEAIREARAVRKQSRRQETLRVQAEAHDTNNRGGRP